MKNNTFMEDAEFISKIHEFIHSASHRKKEQSWIDLGHIKQNECYKMNNAAIEI